MIKNLELSLMYISFKAHLVINNFDCTINIEIKFYTIKYENYADSK